MATGWPVAAAREGRIMFDRATDRLMKSLETIMGLLLAAMVVLVFGNVVLRYGFNSGIAVSEEVSRYLFVWLIFLGAVVAMREHAHLGIDSLVRALPRKGKLLCVVVSDLLMLFAVVLLFQGSWAQTKINMATKSAVAEIPLALLYMAGLVSSVLIGILILRHLYQVLFVGVSDEQLILSVESEDLAALQQKETLIRQEKPL
jgi:TRAP-type C4-dicarboxylate transport system permease small subunit